MFSHCSIFTVFFYVIGDHLERHVLTHAFPTRRSSDLGTRRPAIFGKLAAWHFARAKLIAVMLGPLRAHLREEAIARRFDFDVGDISPRKPSQRESLPVD